MVARECRGLFGHALARPVCSPLLLGAAGVDPLLTLGARLLGGLRGGLGLGGRLGGRLRGGLGVGGGLAAVDVDVPGAVHVRTGGSGDLGSRRRVAALGLEGFGVGCAGGLRLVATDAERLAGVETEGHGGEDGERGELLHDAILR